MYEESAVNIKLKLNRFLRCGSRNIKKCRKLVTVQLYLPIREYHRFTSYVFYFLGSKEHKRHDGNLKNTGSLLQLYLPISEYHTAYVFYFLGSKEHKRHDGNLWRVHLRRLYVHALRHLLVAALGRKDDGCPYICGFVFRKCRSEQWFHVVEWCTRFVC